MSSQDSLYIGLMSGTSMDAIDCALVDFSQPSPILVDFLNLDIPADLKEKFLGLCKSGPNQIHILGEADVEAAQLFSVAALKIIKRNQLKASQIRAIGSHGQTIRHHPPHALIDIPFSLQIADPNTICELTGITTVADFRRHDIAAGGQGAPLVPAFHAELFHQGETPKIILNIGGISNITFLEKSGELVCGFDTGPGNVLLDSWVQQHKNQPYDHNGAWAKTGTPSTMLLQLLLNEPFFHAPHPKSTGRELFNHSWLLSKIKQLPHAIQPEDVQATLVVLTATSISQAILQLISAGDVIICGGGVHNLQLFKALQKTLQDFTIYGSSDIGVDSDSVEAMAFAWFAKQALERKKVNLSPVTGSSKPLIMGGIYHSN